MTLTKADLQAELDKAGIAYPDDAKKADLEALLPEPEPEPDRGPDAEYRILVASGPFSGQEGKVTLARDDGDGWVELGWLEPVKAE